MDKMSKKEITASEEEVQSTDDSAPEAPAEDGVAADADAAAPGDSAVEAAEQEAEAEAATEATDEATSDPASDPASDAPPDDDSPESEASEAEASQGETADSETGDSDTGEKKPRARTRSRRSRSRRKPKGSDRSSDRSSDRNSDRGGSKSSDDADQSDGNDADQGPKDKLRATALWGLHTERKAKMVPFAGYEMPVQYKRGIMAEHRQTRDRAGLFDVSHMGQAFLTLEGEGGHEDIAALLEELVPGNIRGLKEGDIKYTLLLNDEGGIIDDLMVTRPEGEAGNGMLFLVVNAGCKEKDFAHITSRLEGRAKLTVAGDRALIALQGPTASRNLSRYAPFVAQMPFMTAKACRIEGIECLVSRCGYTGEDGYEISLPNEQAETFTRKLLTQRDIALVGLGARDSLRLESGLCLYGHDIDEETTPVEADLMWTIPKRRREAKDFPGADRIMTQFAEGTTRKRVGIKPEGKAPARDGTDIVDTEGKVIGKVTSGGFGPTVRGPVAMGYVEIAQSEADTEVGLMVRGQSRPAKIVPLPFIQPRQFRPGQEVAEPAPELAPEEEASIEEVTEPVAAQEEAAPEVTDEASPEISEETSQEASDEQPDAQDAEPEEVEEPQDDSGEGDSAQDDGENDDERS
jgi:aminomethyltransferase